MRKLGEADIEVKIKGSDLNKLFEIARSTAQKMTALKQFTNVYVAMDLNKPEYQVKIDRAKAADLGVATSEVADTLRILITGSVATRLREGDRDYDIRVMVPESRVNNRTDLENLRITTAQGGFVRLADLATVEPAVGPVEIVRENQVKMVIVRGDAISGVSVGEALGALQGAMAKEAVPAGYEISYGGQAQMMGEMTQSILIILGFAAFFSFIVLTVQFNSLKLPALILASVPFCVPGMAVLLMITGKPLGAPVVIGALVVIAAVVNAGVLLFTYAKVLEEEGLTVRASILKAAMLRLRPRLMVTTAILIGLVPLALALEPGGEMLQPMAIAAIGGLLMENLVSLVLMPCMYLMANREKTGESSGAEVVAT